MATTPQICFVTDRTLLIPTLIATWTLLKRISRAPQIHFWGNGLTKADWEKVERVMATCPEAVLLPYQLDGDELTDARGPSASQHVSAAAMGRLFIPRKLTGRILYIDGDTQVTGDVAPLFDLDMGGKPLGAVRDFVMTKLARRGHGRSARKRRMVERCQRLIGHDSVCSYVNSGVLLIDTDAIRANPALIAGMEDIVRASAYPLGDQDHINHVFSGQIAYLNPSWNASWGRAARQCLFAPQAHANTAETQNDAPRIVHFHGPRKPWKSARLDFWSARFRATQAYRAELRSFLGRFPDLVP